MSGGVTAHSIVRGRRRPSYYRPWAAPPIRPRGQCDGTRSGQVHGNAATERVTVVGALRHPTARAPRGLWKDRSGLDNDLDVVELISQLVDAIQYKRLIFVVI